jgi:hypothetical protein
MKRILILLVLLFTMIGMVAAQDATEEPAADAMDSMDGEAMSYSPGMYIVISTQTVNVRATPSLTGTIINGLGPGYRVAVSGGAEGDVYAGVTTWYQVIVDGEVGYVHGSLLLPFAPLTLDDLVDAVESTDAPAADDAPAAEAAMPEPASTPEAGS